MGEYLIDGTGDGYPVGATSDNRLKTESILTDGTNRATIKTNPNTSSNELLVNLEGHQCPQNTTIIPLVADDFFLGSGWQDTLDYGVLSISVGSDQDSAVDGLEIQWSTDGVNPVVAPDLFTIYANIGKTFTFGPAARYYRVKYTNGPTTQGSFYLVSLLRRNYVKPSSHRINESIVGEDDAELVKAISTGLAPDGTYKNVLVTNAGNQKISIEEFESQVSSNSNTQLNITQFDSTGNEIESALNDSFTDNLDGKYGLTTASILYGRANDGTISPVKIDGTTASLKTITQEHSEIHAGDHFNYCDYALNQASGTIIEFILTTPNTTEWAHLSFTLSASTGATIEIYEGASGITGGTTITPRNNNRNSTNTSSITLIKDPTTITSDGTRAAGFIAGGDRAAGFIERNKEYILKQNETYLLRVTSLAVSNDISWCAEWYEHIGIVAI